MEGCSIGFIASKLKSLRESEKAFKLGVLLLVLNIPLGWLFLVLGGHFSSKYHSSTCMYVFSGLYCLTWVMLGVGLLLSGPEGMKMARKKLSRLTFWKQRASLPE